MTKTVTRSKEIVTRIRQVPPTKNAMAQAIKEQDPWKPTAQDLSDDDSSEFDDDVVKLVEDCVLHGACH